MISPNKYTGERCELVDVLAKETLARHGLTLQAIDGKRLKLVQRHIIIRGEAVELKTVRIFVVVAFDSLFLAPSQRLTE
jgi:hypothetical protein